MDDPGTSFSTGCQGDLGHQREHQQHGRTCDPSRGDDVVQVLVGESVALGVDLAGERSLTEAFTADGGCLVHQDGVVQQFMFPSGLRWHPALRTKVPWLGRALASSCGAGAQKHRKAGLDYFLFRVVGCRRESAGGSSSGSDSAMPNGHCPKGNLRATDRRLSQGQGTPNNPRTGADCWNGLGAGPGGQGTACVAGKWPALSGLLGYRRLGGLGSCYDGGLGFGSWRPVAGARAGCLPG